MKIKTLLAFLLSAALSGCTKDGSDLFSLMQGKWELTSSYSSLSGNQDYVEGNGNTLNFEGNAVTQQIKNADTVYSFSGTFQIFDGKPCDNAKQQTLYKVDSLNEPSSISFNNNQLTIGTTECVADGSSSTYKRIQ